MKKLLLLFIPIGALATDAPPPTDYLAKMIACEEKEERYVDDLYNVFLFLADKKELGKDHFMVPAHFARMNEANYVFERVYYITPNTMKGFALVFPKECLVLKDGMLTPSGPLKLASWKAQQGIQVLSLKKKEPNQSPEPTAGLRPAAAHL